MPTLLHDRPATRDPEVTVRVVTEEPRRRGGGSGRRFTFGGLVTTAGLGAIALVVILFLGAVTGLVDIGNPFGSTTIDNSPPVLLKELRNLSDYNAAQGVFSVRIELHDDVPILPDFIAGSTVDFDGIGTVDATVDFSKLSTTAVQVTGGGSGAGGGDVRITLPEPELGRGVVDPRQSKVVNRDSGIINHIGQMFEDNPTSERDLYLRAAKRIEKAAGESNLVQRAEQNTTAMLKGFLTRLGFTTIDVIFEKPAPAAKTK
jgi:hypothetical protein